MGGREVLYLQAEPPAPPAPEIMPGNEVAATALLRLPKLLGRGGISQLSEPSRAGPQVSTAPGTVTHYHV